MRHICLKPSTSRTAAAETFVGPRATAASAGTNTELEGHDLQLFGDLEAALGQQFAHVSGCVAPLVCHTSFARPAVRTSSIVSSTSCLAGPAPQPKSGTRCSCPSVQTCALVGHLVCSFPVLYCGRASSPHRTPRASSASSQKYISSGSTLPPDRPPPTPLKRCELPLPLSRLRF